MSVAFYHPESEAILKSLSTKLPQSLLLSGPNGIGLRTAANTLAGKNLASVITPQDKTGKSDPDGTITAETIRKLYEQTRSKQVSRHVVIIDNADRMSQAASNAFLKLLEEPSRYIHFILTSHHPEKLLPTIRSRVQHMTLRMILPEQTNALLDDLKITDTTKRRQLEYIAAGLPAELHRLVADNEYFTQRATFVGDARTLLTGSPYDKLLVIQKYQSSRADALRLIDSTLAIARRSISAKPQESLAIQLEQLIKAYDLIAANGNVRLQLARFVL